jgi:hypothetical protein
MTVAKEDIAQIYFISFTGIASQFEASLCKKVRKTL